MLTYEPPYPAKNEICPATRYLVVSDIPNFRKIRCSNKGKKKHLAGINLTWKEFAWAI
jgi:hypothetical protein